MKKQQRHRTPPLGEARRPRARHVIVALTVVAVALSAAVLLTRRASVPRTRDILTAHASTRPQGGLSITYPGAGTLFPPEIVAPTFRWVEKLEQVDRWFLLVQLHASGEVLRFSAEAPRWRPPEEDWARIKEQSVAADAEVIVVGVDDAAPTKILSSASVRIRTSTDEVGDSIFYREVPLPFLTAVRDPSRIRWRFGPITSAAAPPIVLQNLPVCGNCHSFSANGSVLGLDVDYGNDKGAYAITPVAKEMLLNETNIITWADYKREDGDLTFGLLSQVSPDGRYVVSTLKDRSVFVATPEITFSQLFFPIKGILVVYDRETKSFRSLPGADDRDYVQSNPTWSPDGQHIVFARAKAYDVSRLRDQASVLLDERDLPEFVTERKPFRYDLYRIPFNDGRGGTPQPLEGASGDGMSNFFAKYSPDGKWIVFCKAKSYMLLQPDSELYIIPAEGGVPRRLGCNTPRMNSWHSWSSNSRWLVFSSKANTPYTQLFLTHIDENGRDSPPVLLERFTATDRAANIPEFVKLQPDAIARIREEFLDAYSFLRAGSANDRTGDHPGAERAYRRGLELAPENPDLRNALGWNLFQQGKTGEAIGEYERALAADPRHVKAHNNLALAYVEVGQLEKAAVHYRKSIEVEPKAEVYSDLGFVLDRQGKTEEAIGWYGKALDLDPKCAPAHFNLAVALVRGGKLEDAASHYRAALQAKPTPETYNGLGFVLSKQGQLDEAIVQYREAIRANPKYVAAYNNLAEGLVQQGKLEEAVSYYETSLRQMPSATVHNDLGAVLVRLGRTEEAIGQFREAIAMSPDYAAAQRNLGALLASQRHPAAGRYE